MHSIHAGADRCDGPLRNSGSTRRDSQKSHIPAAMENCTLLSSSVSLSLNLIRWEPSSYRAVSRGRTYSEQKKKEEGTPSPTMALAEKRGEDNVKASSQFWLFIKSAEFELLNWECVCNLKWLKVSSYQRVTRKTKLCSLSQSLRFQERARENLNFPHQIHFNDEWETMQSYTLSYFTRESWFIYLIHNEREKEGEG